MSLSRSTTSTLVSDSAEPAAAAAAAAAADDPAPPPPRRRLRHTSVPRSQQQRSPTKASSASTTATAMPSDFLHQLTRNAHATKSHFALLWIDDDGPAAAVHMLGSQLFTPKLKEWFSTAVVDQAKLLVQLATTKEQQQQLKRSNCLAFEERDELEEEEDEKKPNLVDDDTAESDEHMMEQEDEELVPFEQQQEEDRNRIDDDDDDTMLGVQEDDEDEEGNDCGSPSPDRPAAWPPSIISIAAPSSAAVSGLSRTTSSYGAGFGSPSKAKRPFPAGLTRSHSITSTFPSLHPTPIIPLASPTSAGRSIFPAFAPLPPLPLAPPAASTSSMYKLTHRQHYGTSLTNDEDYTSVSLTAPILGLWYVDQLAQLAPKTSKAVAAAWVRVINPTFAQSGTVGGVKDNVKPDWWPEDLRYRDPDRLTKPERNNLCMNLLRFCGISIDRFKASTMVIEKTMRAARSVVLRDIYRVASMEQDILRESDGRPLSELTIKLPLSAMLLVSSPAKSIVALAPRMRKSLTTSSLASLDHRTSPYVRSPPPVLPSSRSSLKIRQQPINELTRSLSTNINDWIEPEQTARPLVRSQSLSGHPLYYSELGAASSVDGGADRRRARKGGRHSLMFDFDPSVVSNHPPEQLELQHSQQQHDHSHPNPILFPASSDAATSSALHRHFHHPVTALQPSLLVRSPSSSSSVSSMQQQHFYRPHSNDDSASHHFPPLASIAEPLSHQFYPSSPDRSAAAANASAPSAAATTYRTCQRSSEPSFASPAMIRSSTTMSRLSSSGSATSGRSNDSSMGLTSASMGGTASTSMCSSSGSLLRSRTMVGMGSIDEGAVDENEADSEESNRYIQHQRLYQQHQHQAPEVFDVHPDHQLNLPTLPDSYSASKSGGYGVYISPGQILAPRPKLPIEVRSNPYVVSLEEQSLHIQLAQEEQRRDEEMMQERYQYSQQPQFHLQQQQDLQHIQPQQQQGVSPASTIKPPSLPLMLQFYPTDEESQLSITQSQQSQQDENSYMPSDINDPLHNGFPRSVQYYSSDTHTVVEVGMVGEAEEAELLGNGGAEYSSLAGYAFGTPRCEEYDEANDYEENCEGYSSGAESMLS